MPKVLIQFDGSSRDAAQAARTVADGAESVRFTEVEVRALDARERLADYDGVVFVASGAGMAAAAESLAGQLTDKVGAVVAPDGTDAQPALVAAMLRAGMIVVGAGTEDEARTLGARVAKVTEWVRHARSHHHQHHTHSH